MFLFRRSLYLYDITEAYVSYVSMTPTFLNISLWWNDAKLTKWRLSARQKWRLSETKITTWFNKTNDYFRPKIFWRVSANIFDEFWPTFLTSFGLNYMSLWWRDELNKLNSLTVWRSDFRSADPTISIRWSGNPTIRRSNHPAIQQSDDLDPTIRQSDLGLSACDNCDAKISSSAKFEKMGTSYIFLRSARVGARRPGDFLLAATFFCLRRLSACGDFLLAAKFGVGVLTKQKALKPSRLNSWCRLRHG